MFQIWMVFRYLKAGSRFVSLTSVFAVISMTIGVAALFISMSVVNGFEDAIHTSAIDITGHVIILKRGKRIEPLETIMPRIQKMAPEVIGVSPFIELEGMIAKKGKLLGVSARGFEMNLLHKYLPMDHKIISGNMNVGDNGAILGSELAKRFDLHVGDTFKLVIPATIKSNSQGFQSQVTSLVVSGIIDLGKYEYNERILLTSDTVLRAINGFKVGEFSALRLILKDKNEAAKTSLKLTAQLGDEYWARDWYQHNRNFLSAVEYEKYIIFFVLQIMVVAACFNISSSLFISVLKRYGDISILKSLGASPRFLVQLFSAQGVLIAVLGNIFGFLIGGFILSLIPRLKFFEIPAEVYKVGHLPFDIRFWDCLIIFISSVLLSYLSTLLPAFRGSKLSPVEGLRYE